MGLSNFDSNTGADGDLGIFPIDGSCGRVSVWISRAVIGGTVGSINLFGCVGPVNVDSLF